MRYRIDPFSGELRPFGKHPLGGVDFHGLHESGDSDPLAGIDFALRLQTHKGDGVPIGLYQDTDCTVPATEEGDSIAAWRDELSGNGLAATQSNSMFQPTLHFESGVPEVLFDGVDDTLTFSSLAITLITIRLRGLDGIVDYAHALGISTSDTTNYWHGGAGTEFFYTGSIYFQTIGGTAWDNGSSVGTAANLTRPLDSLHTLQIQPTTPQDADQLGHWDRASQAGVRFWKGPWRFVGINLTALSSEDRSLVESYTSAL